MTVIVPTHTNTHIPHTGDRVLLTLRLVLCKGRAALNAGEHLFPLKAINTRLCVGVAVLSFTDPDFVS